MIYLGIGLGVVIVLTLTIALIVISKLNSIHTLANSNLAAANERLDTALQHQVATNARLDTALREITNLQGLVGKLEALLAGGQRIAP